jgi:dienelactone hydrolase
MYRRCIMAVALCIGMAVMAEAQTVPVQSGRYADFRHLLSREPPTSRIEIDMTLRFPDEALDRHPAVVVVHTLGGYQRANEGWHAKAFREAGFATLTYDSAAAQRLRTGGGPDAWASAVAEAFDAFRLLARHPRIDANRIAIVGFSFGGEVSYLSALEPIRAALVSTGSRFAAHIAYYPAGVHAAVADGHPHTGAPILMLLGEKDDNLPVPKVLDYLAYARAAGNKSPLDVAIYPGAHHAWTVPSLGAPRLYAQYQSTRKCPYVMMGGSAPTLLVGGKLVPLERGSLVDCVREGRGYTMGYDEVARTMALRDTLLFLRRNLDP